MNEHQTPPAVVKIGGLSVTHGWASDLRALASQIIDRVMDGETRAYAIAEMIAKHVAETPQLSVLSTPEADAFAVGWDMHRRGKTLEDVQQNEAFIAQMPDTWVSPEQRAAGKHAIDGWTARQSRHVPNT